MPKYDFWETYFKKGIEESFCDWVEAPKVDWAEGLSLSGKALVTWQDKTWNQAIRFIRGEHRKRKIDVFLSYLFPKQIIPSAIQEIQSLGIPCVNFFCDNVREFTKVPKEFYCFDLHWVPEYKALPLYQKAQLKYVYAPMPVWIPSDQRNTVHSENYGVTFIGSHDIQREMLLSQILKSGINLEIRGAGWLRSSDISKDLKHTSPKTAKFLHTIENQLEFIQNQGLRAWLRKLDIRLKLRIPHHNFDDFVRPSPSDAEYIKIIQESMITLGINRYPSYRYDLLRPNTYSRMRDIEAPMMGACYLTEWTEGLEELYILGKEIETYRNAEELLEKIHYLAASPEVRKMLRVNGQKRALSDHTISRSIIKISKIISS
ncbi:MAG: glycosyltransferase [Pseudanabaena sp. ELA607]